MASGQAVVTWNTYRTLDCQPTGVNIKASAGEIAWYITNQASSVRYVKLYDKATAPSSSDTPLLTIGIPANSAANVLAPAGVNTANGIGIRGTTGVADNDTGAPTANDIIVNVFYK
jgi:hypothetical protein